MDLAIVLMSVATLILLVTLIYQMKAQKIEENFHDQKASDATIESVRFLRIL